MTYVVFRFTSSHNSVDPWCLESFQCANGITFSGETLTIFLVQIFTTFFGYAFAWIACTMTRGPYIMGGALLLSTPLSLAAYYIHTFGTLVPSVPFFPAFTSNSEFKNDYLWASLILFCFVWLLGQVLGMGFYICCKKNNAILSKDWNMFLIPYYDGIFLEQQLMLNRQDFEIPIQPDKKDTIKRAVFICTPMYHENVTEMKQLLGSIYNMVKHYHNEQSEDSKEALESHIFFDGALVGTQLQKYGLQLLSLLENTLTIKAEDGDKIKTPYGMRFQYKLTDPEKQIHVPFYIHFKDMTLVKPKKRWSQVMYMNYIIKYCIKFNEKFKGLSPENIFILMTDADIDFTPKSAIRLLDVLESNPLVGAVCARTYPKRSESGLWSLYWYQVFDYAVGHWFQKPAEHMFGCVLCCPGCFSVFRCSALQEILKEYSSKATNGMEFLMKDMGEDRWLCTLLIKKGWRLEYCALSNNKTFCPSDFGEFYAQRRRWTASTIANLISLISGIWKIPQGNDTISVLFIVFQAVIFFSTIISPATVILVIASGLQSAYQFSDQTALFIISLLIFVSFLYGIICLFTSQKTQIDVSKILTLLFAIVMITVVAGIFRELVIDISSQLQLIKLEAPNCTALNTSNCTAAAKLTLPSYSTFTLPISVSIIYIGVFAITFFIAAVLHPANFEWCSVFHCIWYLLALPSGYLLLLIYSAANLDSQSWGTREVRSGTDDGLLGWWNYFKKACSIKTCSCCTCCTCCTQGKQETNQAEVDEEDEVPLRSGKF